MFEKIIKIPGKSFDDLSIEEIGLMIEADSSISSSGNDYFSSCALDEFLYNGDVKRKDLKCLQKYILENIYIDIKFSSNKEINKNFLRDLSVEIKSGNFCIPETQ